MRVFRWVWWRWARYALTMRVHFNQWWMPARWGAMCLGRHVFTNRPTLWVWVTDHEYRHVQQYARHGVVWYLVQWFWWTWRVGYAANPFERDAQAYAQRKQDHRWRHERAWFNDYTWPEPLEPWTSDSGVVVCGGYVEQPDLFDAY